MSKTSPTAAELRAWARGKGMDVGDRGRLSPEILEAWQAAHAKSAPAKTPKPSTAAAAKARPTVKAAKPVPAAKVTMAAKPSTRPAPTTKVIPVVKVPAALETAPLESTKEATPIVVKAAEATESSRVVALEAQVSLLTARVATLENAAPARRRGLRRRS